MWRAISRPNANNTTPAIIGRRLFDVSQLAESPAGEEGGHVEVQPPQRRHDDHSQRGGEDDVSIEVVPDAGANGDNGLAKGDEDDEPVSLGEVLGRDVPAPEVGNERPAVVDGHCEHPQAETRRVVEDAGDDEQDACGQLGGRE